MTAPHDHAPRFLQTTAKDIEAWADRNEARSRLAVLLRRLIHATGTGVSAIDFPGYDNSERPGWDGWLESSHATAWIPEGKSAWEFGSGQNPRQKAQEDYATRTSSVSVDERKEISFVFVTPRNWRGKRKWAEERRQEGQWRDIRVYDASDLESWLEQAMPAQVWFAEQIGRDFGSIRSVERAWNDWAAVTNPPLPPSLFELAAKEFEKEISDWLESAHPKEMLSVSADSQEEALAFVCAFLLRNFSNERNSKDVWPYADQAAVVSTKEDLRRLECSTSPCIAIIDDPALARDAGDFFRRFPTIAVFLRNFVSGKMKIALGQLRYDDFRKALEGSNFAKADIESLARRSGRSITVLRRLLSANPSLRCPHWAENANIARKLVPYALIGAWNTKGQDASVLELITDIPQGQLTAELPELLALNDSPVWRIGGICGATSQFDLIFAIKEHITPEIIERFLEVAELVLKEKDPSIDLESDKRWLALVYGKTRECSRELRRAMSDTIVLLAVHGKNLFGTRVDCAGLIRQLVRKLMMPLDDEKLFSQRNELVFYAEAAPDVFLGILEEADEDVLKEFVTSSSSSMFEECLRAPLLWALESMAWEPQYLPRVCCLLAKLSEYPIQDNHSNTPANSFNSILKSWCPRTLASLEERKDVLRLVCSRYPKFGWKLAVSFLITRHDISFPTYEPRWRRAVGLGSQAVTYRDEYEFRKFAFELCLGAEALDYDALSILVDKAAFLPVDWVNQIWEQIKKWAEAENRTEQEKAEMREKIRQRVLTPRARQGEDSDEFSKGAWAMYELLKPKSVIQRHQWLFKNSWVDFRGEEVKSLDAHEEKVRKMRAKAVAEIYAQRGIDGIFELAGLSGASHIVGDVAERVVKTQEEKLSLFLRSLHTDEEQTKNRFHRFGSGLLNSMLAPQRIAFLEAIRKGWAAEEFVLALALARIDDALLKIVDSLDESHQLEYWKSVRPETGNFNRDEINRVIEGLLRANRSGIAAGVSFYGDVSSENLVQILKDVSSCQASKFSSFHEIEFIFKKLNERGHNKQELAALEMSYLPVLMHANYGIPNLERVILSDPNLFVQVLACIYRRKDDLEDPKEWQIQNEQERGHRATRMFELLLSINRTPGSDADGNIDGDFLLEWVRQARGLCAQCGRAEIGDLEIGKLLSNCPAGEDGVRPCEEVCEVMETVGTDSCLNGFRTGTYNRRGAHIREEGGQQERALAEQYRQWGKVRGPRYPFVGRVLNTVADTYEHDAVRMDEKSDIERRTED